MLLCPVGSLLSSNSMLLKLFDQTDYRADCFGTILFHNLPWRNLLNRSENHLLTVFIHKNVANIHHSCSQLLLLTDRWRRRTLVALT